MPCRATSAFVSLALLAAFAIPFAAPREARSQTTTFTQGVTWTNAGIRTTSRTFRVPGVVGLSNRAGFIGFDGVWFTTTGFRPIGGIPLVEIARRTDPQIRAGFRPEQQQPEDTAPPDRGLVAFARGDYATAYNEYAVRARFRPTDLEARRLQALAAAGRGNFDEAGQILLDVYEREPGLRHARLPAQQVVGADELRKLIAQGVRRAESVDTREVWFAAAVLSHAAGRSVAAEVLYDRSLQSGHRAR